MIGGPRGEPSGRGENRVEAVGIAVAHAGRMGDVLPSLLRCSTSLTSIWRGANWCEAVLPCAEPPAAAHCLVMGIEVPEGPAGGREVLASLTACRGVG